MGHVDPMTRKLLEWQLRHEHNQTAVTPQGPSAPQRKTRSQKDRSANIHNQRRMEDRGGVSKDAAAEDETDEDYRTDGDYPGESKDESDDDDWQLICKHESDMDSKKQVSCVSSVVVPRQSPKRKRGMMAASSQGDVPSFPSPTPASMYPVYNQYPGSGSHMQLAGSSSALGNFIPHPSMPSMEPIAAHQDGVTPENCFYSDMGWVWGTSTSEPTIHLSLTLKSCLFDLYQGLHCRSRRFQEKVRAPRARKEVRE